MNKKIKIILGIVITTLIIGGVIFIIDYNRCANLADKNSNEIKMNNETMNNNSDKNYSFRAIVVKSTEKVIEVKPIEEKDIKLLSDRVSIGLGENNDMVYFEGTELLITYTGDIMDSYPTQIKVVNIQTEALEKITSD